MTLHRILVVIAALVLVPAALLVVFILVLQSPWAERWLESRLGDHIERQVEIERIRVGFEWPPAINIGRLRIGNPSWAKTPNLVDAESLHAKVELLPLF